MRTDRGTLLFYITSIFYGALWCSIHEKFGHSMCFTAFIKRSIKFSKGMSNIVKDFNYSRKLCNVVNLKLKLNTVLQISVLLNKSTSSRQDLDKLVTNIPELIKYGEFCKIISKPIKCISEESLSFGSTAFKWEQNI